LRVIANKTLREFFEQPIYKDSECALQSWYYEVSKANWSNPNEIKTRYKSASIIGEKKVIFNICGNKYRLIVKINYSTKIVYIKFIGTHKQYDKISIDNL